MFLALGVPRNANVVCLRALAAPHPAWTEAGYCPSSGNRTLSVPNNEKVGMWTCLPQHQPCAPQDIFFYHKDLWKNMASTLWLPKGPEVRAGWTSRLVEGDREVPETDHTEPTWPLLHGSGTPPCGDPQVPGRSCSPAPVFPECHSCQMGTTSYTCFHTWHFSVHLPWASRGAGGWGSILCPGAAYTLARGITERRRTCKWATPLSRRHVMTSRILFLVVNFK